MSLYSTVGPSLMVQMTRVVLRGGSRRTLDEAVPAVRCEVGAETCESAVVRLAVFMSALLFGVPPVSAGASDGNSDGREERATTFVGAGRAE